MSGRVYSATYIGGHPDFQKKETVRIYLASDELRIAPLAIKIKYSEDSSIYELFFSDIPNMDELNNELKKLREKPLIEEVKKPKVKKITEKETTWEKISKSKISVILVSIIVGMLVVLAVSLPYIITLSKQPSLSPLTTSTTPLTEISEIEGKITITYRESTTSIIEAKV